MLEDFVLCPPSVNDHEKQKAFAFTKRTRLLKKTAKRKKLSHKNRITLTKMKNMNFSGKTVAVMLLKNRYLFYSIMFVLHFQFVQNV